RLGESAYEGARFLGHELGGHVLGLVGYGNVGRRVSRRALAFGMTGAVYDPFVEVENGDGAMQVHSLDDLLKTAYFVSLHVRASAQTENLFGPEEFARMKKGAYFVNTARETLVDEAALDEVLSSDGMGGRCSNVITACLVCCPHPLLEHDN